VQTPITIDFETESIEERPKYPPKPVGLAIKYPGKKGKYLAWGHPDKNNTTRAKAQEELKDIYKSGAPILTHNGKFDLDVAHNHFGLALPTWDRLHDTLFTLFLTNPHAASLSLKPAAEHYLGLPPEEQDAVKDWLVQHKVIAANQRHGAFISKAPGDVVGRYAIGDVERTLALHKLLHPKLDPKELKAYDRERRLLPILLANEGLGIRVDVEKLGYDVEIYKAALDKADKWLRKRLGDINLDADREVAHALKAKGIVTDFVKTPTGQDSVSKKNLTIDLFSDKRVALALGYRNRLVTVLSMSMLPWLAQAQENNGHIFTEWNQVRQSHGNDGSKGTRSGRLSCSRLMNITKDFTDKGDGYTHPAFLKLPELPLVRRYLVPDGKSDLFLHRDYNQQEFRILAHFEDAELMKSYNDNPKIDYHTAMQARIKEMVGLELPRRAVKILNFGILYGMGARKLAEGLGVTVDEARRLRNAQKKAAPGVALLDRDLKTKGREGDAIRTWGGRRYFCEAPRVINGIERTFEYKLLNYLIQGSAADCTKEALTRLHDEKWEGRFLVTVHDEINLSTPKAAVKKSNETLRKVMESIEFDVPMLSDAKVGPSWGDLKKIEEK
jgi:DNA polymerase-1